MKKVIIILILLFYSINSFAQNDKEEAKVFFKTVIKSYFDTCNFFFESLADSIIPIGMHEGFYFPKNKIDRNKICSRILQLKNGFKQYANYENKYQIVVYDKQEFTSKSKGEVIKDSFLLKNENVGFVFMILNLFNKLYTNDDYLVVGNFPRNEKKKEILDGMFWFVARKTSSKWKIIAMHE